MNRIFLTFFMAAVMIFTASPSADAQSHDFKLGKWTQIHSSILKELNLSYVDTLPVDK